MKLLFIPRGRYKQDASIFPKNKLSKKKNKKKKKKKVRNQYPSKLHLLATNPPLSTQPTSTNHSRIINKVRN